jgi:hypothetical protein
VPGVTELAALLGAALLMFCQWCRARVVQAAPRGEGRCKSFLVLFSKKEPLPDLITQ